MLTWPLMARGGLVIFDDYEWKEMPKPLDNPKPGIDAFLKTIAGQYRVVLDELSGRDRQAVRWRRIR